jgi:leucyl/phenylalanyl-tRNA--protein transferase
MLLDVALENRADFGALPLDRPVPGADALGIIASRP